MDIATLQALLAQPALARYSAEAPPRAGGGGAVFRCRDEAGRRVALKLIPLRETRDAERFRREVAALEAIDHPFVAEPIAHGRLAGGPIPAGYLVTEWIEGQTLEESVSSQGPWSEARARTVFAQLAEGLEACHAAGLVHRDLKPANILIEARTGAPVIIDFGLVRWEAPLEASFAEASLTRTGELLGTPRFMAPEQLEAGAAFGAVGPETDVWGLGGCLLYALSGASPYHGREGLALYGALATSEPIDAREVGVPAGLAEVIHGCLRKASAERWTLPEVAEALSAAPSSHLSLPRLALLALLFGAILGGLGLALFAPPPLELLELEAEAPLTGAEEVLIRGQVTRPGAALALVGGAARVVMQSDAEGRFEVAALLAEGPNRLQVEGLAGAEVTVTRDSEAPLIEVSNAREDGGPWLLTELNELEGRVRDLSPEELRCGEQVLELDREGGFSLLLSPPGPEPWTVTLIARDALGQRAEMALVVETLEMRSARQAAAHLAREAEQRAAREAEARRERWREQVEATLDGISPDPLMRAALAPLMWIERWREASPSAQDEAMLAVKALRREAFAFLGPETYRCEGLELRIGRFQHRATGLVLHLIPGGARSFEFFKDERARPVITQLRVLSREDSGREAFVDALEDDFSPGLHASLAKALGSPHGEVARPTREQVQDIAEHFWSDPERLAELRILFIRSANGLARQVGSTTQELYLPPLLVAARELDCGTWAAHWEDEPGVSSPWQGRPEREALSGVSLPQARAWCRATGLRLPSVWEWRWACQGGREGPWFWGEELALGARYVWAESSEGADPLRSVDDHAEATSAYGLSDILGHVAEWCEKGDGRFLDAWIRAGVPFLEVEKFERLDDATDALAGGSVWHALSRCREDTIDAVPEDRGWGRSGMRVVADLSPEPPKAEGAPR